MEINPNLGEAFYNRGCAFYKIKRFNKAIKDFTRVIDKNPGFRDAYYNRALSYYQLKNYESARKDIEKMKGMGYEVDNNLIKAIEKELNSPSGINK